MTLLLFVGVSLFAFAQTETGQIGGTVTDPSGAVVAGAKVTVKSTTTQATRVATTDSGGNYNVTNLQPGIYEVKFEGQGFAPQTRRAQVTVGSRVSLNTGLTVEASATTVEVVGSGGVQVETEKTELSQVVSGKQITELPTFNRNAYALVTQSANVSTADPTGRGVGVAINGQRAASTSITLDGAENVDLFTASLGQPVPLDAVQEFRVINSNFGAEYGRASGGVVNVATKAGTNSFHGTLYEFYRGSSLGANTYDNNANDIQKPRYVRNQFGYSIGGPIAQDKLFFFNSTEFIRVRSASTQQVYVAMPQFIAAAAADTQAFFAAFGQLSTPVNGTILTKNDLALPPVGGSGNYDALPGTTPIFGQVKYLTPTDAGGGAPQNQYQTTTRVDFNWTDKTTLFGRYSVQRADQFKGSVSHSPYKGYSTGAEVYAANVMLNVTHLFSDRMVSSTKLVYNRNRSDTPLGENPAGPTLYYRAVTTRVSGDRVAGPGYLPFNPGSAIPFQGPQNLYQINQDFNWSVGKHQIKFGGQFVHTRDNREFGAFKNSVQELSTSGLGVGLNNFLRGQLTRFQGAVDPQGKFPCVRDANQVIVVTPACQVTTPLSPPDFDRNNRYNDSGLYIQDAWKIMSRLTLNLGLRWEYFGVQHNIDPKQDSNFYYGTGANIFEQIRNGKAFATPDSPVKGLWNRDFNNFAPRIGFAWDVFGSGKTSLRGGYGIGFERNFGNVTYNVLFNPPFFAALSVNSTDVAGNLPVTTDNNGPLGGVPGIVKNLTNLQLRHIDQNIKTAYAHQWNLALEQELRSGTVASVAYSASKGVDLYSLENPNRPGSGVIFGGDAVGGARTTGRLNRQFTNLNTRRNNGMSDYNAMIGSIRSSNLFNQGLNFSANYTWAHTIDNLSSTFSESGNNYNLGLLDPFNPALDRGNADFDLRHRFVSGLVWELPYFKSSSNNFMKYVIGGWTLAPSFTAQSGAPFSVYDCNYGFQTCHRIVPDGSITLKGKGDPPLQKDSLGQPIPNTFQYIDLSSTAFTSYFNPVLGAAGFFTSDFGNCTAPGQGATQICPYPERMTRRNSFRGPGNWNVDFGIYKNVKVTEGFGLQFRGELFNAFNHSNLYVDISTPDVASQDYVGAFRADNRNIQLAVKIIF
ncbi:MAG: TonB-dependent receptor [Terriglobales bacterium]